MTAIDYTAYTGSANPAVRWANPWLRDRVTAVADTWHTLTRTERDPDLTGALRDAQHQNLHPRDIELLTCLRITACQSPDQLEDALHLLGDAPDHERGMRVDQVLHLIHEAVGPCGWNDLLLVTAR